MGKGMTENKRIERFKNLMGPWITQEILEYLVDNGFFTAPASKTFHGNYPGGLDDHSFEVTQYLVHLTTQLGIEWDNPRSPYVVGYFHDLCKMKAYQFVRFDAPEMGYENRDTDLMWGHGDKSVMMLCQYMKLTEEEVACIRYHMGAYEKEDWTYFDRSIRKYPSVLFTHTADMYASKVLNT